MELQPSLLKVGAANSVMQRGDDQPGPMACQECGNRAKRDCNYNRCRTCCKSRGFVCATHVKSTWVPAAKRREKQRVDAVCKAGTDHMLTSLERTHRSSSSSLPSTSSTMIASSQARPNLLALGPVQGVANNMKVSLPSEVTAHTLLKSVKMTGIVDGVLDVGYHASTKIGGHLFKGVLFNAGPDMCSASASSDQSLQDLSLIALKGPPAANLLESSGGLLYGTNLSFLGSNHLKREEDVAAAAAAAGVQSMVRSMLTREYWDNSTPKVFDGSHQAAVWGHNAPHSKYTTDST